MGEIKVGEYIRTKTGYIDKIKGIDISFDNTKYYIVDDDYIYFRKSIIKHSKNIIDLIQVGDFVNGKQIIKILNIKVHDAETKLLIYDDKLLGKGLYRGAFKENEIKSIVSHEMFEGIKYEVN